MSNKFHSKWHRQNHHTDPSSNNADSSHDPIASPAQPFRGIFATNGMISGNASPRSAQFDHELYAESIYTPAITAVYMEVQVIDVKQYELSAYAIQGNTWEKVFPHDNPLYLYDALSLSGVGLSASSWVIFDGSLEVGLSATVPLLSTNTIQTINLSTDNLTADLTYSDVLCARQIVTTNNLYVSGTLFTSNLSLSGGSTTIMGTVTSDGTFQATGEYLQLNVNGNIRYITLYQLL